MNFIIFPFIKKESKLRQWWELLSVLTVVNFDLTVFNVVDSVVDGEEQEQHVLLEICA